MDAYIQTLLAQTDCIATLKGLPLSTTANILHIAAATGNMDCVFWLLQQGFSWNTMHDGRSVGEVCMQHGHFDLYSALIAEGVRAELLLTMVGQTFADEKLVLDKQISNQRYLESRLVYTDDRVLDADGNAVMMGWEAPLMKFHADQICKSGSKVLNVGFGLGIIDNFIQQNSPSHHTIIEAHPDVYAKMIQDGWDKKQNVRILFGRWQDMLESLESYDGIFFDTFGEFYDDLKEFNDIVPNILNTNGVYSFFNGLAGTNQFFHDVACSIVEVDLNDCEMQVDYQVVDMEELGDEVWQGTRRAYWNLPQYRLPIVRFRL